MSFIGFGHDPRCPNCGASTSLRDERDIYLCASCGTRHERDDRGRLLTAEGRRIP